MTELTGFLKARISIRRSHIFTLSEWRHQFDWLRFDVARLVRAVADRIDGESLLRIDRHAFRSLDHEPSEPSTNASFRRTPSATSWAR